MLFVLTIGQVRGQVPCPVALTAGNEKTDRIEVSFMNKGKLPIEQLRLSCVPGTSQSSRIGTCLTKDGIFYPGTQYWIDIFYPGANRRGITVTVESVQLAGGVTWNRRSADSCRALRIRRKL